MKESLYLALRRYLTETPEYQDIKEEFTQTMRKGAVGIIVQEPEREDCLCLAAGKLKELISSRSRYAMFLINLAALDDAVEEFQERTGFAAYTDVLYIPCTVQKNLSEGILADGELIKCAVSQEEAKRCCQDAYWLAEPYEIENSLEEELNRFVEKSIYQKIYVAGKLEIAPVFYCAVGKEKKEEHSFRMGV